MDWTQAEFPTNSWGLGAWFNQGNQNDYKMTDQGATPVATLEKIYNKAKELGLRYPYVGNVWDSGYENTYCPACGAMLIERQGFSSLMRDLDGEQCGNCGEKIEIVRHVR